MIYRPTFMFIMYYSKVWKNQNVKVESLLLLKLANTILLQFFYWELASQCLYIFPSVKIIEFYYKIFISVSRWRLCSILRPSRSKSWASRGEIIWGLRERWMITGWGVRWGNGREYSQGLMWNSSRLRQKKRWGREPSSISKLKAPQSWQC